MNTNAENLKILTHDFPVWRERSNFIIGISLNDPVVAHIVTSEQIWARQIEKNTFEVCCIPFAAYGLALGDIVSTHPEGGRNYMIDNVLEKKGHATYRIYFIEIHKWDAVVANIIDLGCLVEKRWERSTLVAIDAPSPKIVIALDAHLRDLVDNEVVIVENGT